MWFHEECNCLFLPNVNGIKLIHWGRVTHICVGKLTIIGSDNDLSPGRRQAIVWTNAEISLIGSLGTNCSEMLTAIHTFSFKKMHLKLSSGKWRPFCLGLIVLIRCWSYHKISCLISASCSLKVGFWTISTKLYGDRDYLVDGLNVQSNWRPRMGAYALVLLFATRGWTH